MKMTNKTLQRSALFAALTLGLAGCAVVKLPIKVAGAVATTAIDVVTRSDYRPH